MVSGCSESGVWSMNDILVLIKRHRVRRGWSEYNLAEKADVPQSTISSWYRKDIVPSIASLQKICVAFGMTMSQFFAFDGDSVPLTSEQLILLNQWSTLTPEQKKIILYIIGLMNTV